MNKKLMEKYVQCEIVKYYETKNYISAMNLMYDIVMYKLNTEKSTSEF